MLMQFIYSIIGVAIGGLFAYILLSRKKEQPQAPTDNTGFQLLAQQMNELQKVVDQKLSDNEKNLTENLKFQSTQSNKIIIEGGPNGSGVVPYLPLPQIQKSIGQSN